MIYFLTELNSLGAGALITEGNAVKLDERLHVCATRAYRRCDTRSGPIFFTTDTGSKHIRQSESRFAERVN